MAMAGFPGMSRGNRKLIVSASAKMPKNVLKTDSAPLVSTDYIGNVHSSTVDAELTTVVGDLVKVFSWYDNEMGYAQRTFDLAKFVGGKL